MREVKIRHESSHCKTIGSEGGRKEKEFSGELRKGYIWGRVNKFGMLE